MTIKCKSLTFGDNPLQPDDVWVIELAHDARLAQKITPLLLCVTRFQTLDGHIDLALAWQLQTAATHLTKFPLGVVQSVSTYLTEEEKKRVVAVQVTVCWVDSNLISDSSLHSVTLKP